jgi:DNA polymerase-1
MAIDLLIVDGNALGHRAKHTTGTMKWSGEYTGVVYGFFTQLFNILKKYNPKQTCFAWDSSASLRKDIFPSYKEKRKLSKSLKSAEEKAFDRACYAQFYEIYEEIISAIGFTNNWKIKGYEGDDVIASICLSNKKATKVIATSDNDMFQLLTRDEEIGIYDIRNKAHIGKYEFYKIYGIEASQWKDVKCLAGCSGDEVPGIPGVAVPTAIKYLNGELKSSSKVFQRIESAEGKAIIERNRKLVVLPFAGTPKLKLEKDNIDFTKMKSIFMDHGFGSLYSKDKFQEWKRLLGGNK